MITPFYHSAKRERVKEIQNFINCSHTTSQATCTWKNLHWSRWIAESGIKDFQNVYFKINWILRQGLGKHTIYKDGKAFIIGTFKKV